jgi:hypothetical protein
MKAQLLNDFSRLFLGGLLGVGTYATTSFLLKINSLTELIDIIKRK